MVTSWKRRPFSLKFRLTFFISLAAIITFAAFAEIMLRSVQTHFAEQDVMNLQQINSALSGILQTSGESEQQKAEKINIALASYHHVSVLLLNSQHRVVYSSADGPVLMPVLSSANFRKQLGSGEVFLWPDHQGDTTTMHTGGEMEPTIYRIIASSIEAATDDTSGPHTLLIALSIDFHLHYLDALKHKLLMIAATMSLFIIFIVLFSVHKGHQPLRNVSMRIKSITSENLDVRLEPDRVPIELEQLVISFNHMIARIEDVFTRQANFSADIAHEIRTPITNLATQTEIALSQQRTAKELEDVLYSNLEEYNRMAKMVSDMLFLAQADNNQLIPESIPLDLQAETLKVFEFFEAWAEERGVGLKLDNHSGFVEGDPLMLRRVINNLLSNAIRYTPSGGSVTVHLCERDEWVELSVENPGVPIPPEHLPRLFDRFYRVDPSRQPKGEGSGIGLAIVKSIVAVHHGKISVESDTLSTRFSISLPRIEL